MNDIIENLLYVVIAGFIIIVCGGAIFLCQYKIKQCLNSNNENQLLVLV